MPQVSIIANNDERFVWLVRGNNAVKQVIKLAQNTNDGYTVVTEGLAKGDLVVKTGMQNLKFDSQINVIDDKSTQDKPVTSNVGASTDSSSAPSTGSSSGPSTDSSSVQSTDSSSAPSTDSSSTPSTDSSLAPSTAPNAKGAQ